MRRLNAWNPLDHLRLLGWVFFAPGRVAEHQQTFGEESIRMTGSWLTSSLTWFPLMIPLMGYGLETVPLAASRSGVSLAIFFIFVWLLTGFLGNRTREIVGFMSGATVFFMLLGIVFAITAGVRPGIVAASALIASGLVVRGLGVVLGGHLAANVAGGVGLGMAAGTSVVIFGGPLAGVIVGIIFPISIGLGYLLSLGVSNHLQKTIKTGHRSPLSLLFLGCIAVGWIVPTWIFFLGGWNTLAV